jgi:hypothetical protein
MNGIARHNRQWLATGTAILLLAGGLRASDNASGTSSLSALERRALKAQALIDEVTRLNTVLQETKDQLAKAEAEVALLKTKLDTQEKHSETLSKKLAESNHENQKKDHLLSLLRSGAFEYYEVRDGDTLASIAANPMVYGNKDRAKWIRQVNGLGETVEPPVGTVLIIPRYTEGAGYDF